MSYSNRSRLLRRTLTALTVISAMVAGGLIATASEAIAAGNRIDLRALVVDDGSVWVRAVTDQFTTEGVPFTTVALADANRPSITASLLSTGSEARFQAVVLPDDLGGGLPATELAALAAYEARFAVRQVDAYTWANPTVGLNYAQNPGYIGDLTGMTGTVQPEARAAGFGYSSGTVPIGAGSYGYLATPAGPGVMPVGGTFTPFVTVPIPGSTAQGSLVGVYANGGVERLVITAAMATSLSHFRILAHGIVSWVTRGVHFGFDRNYLTFHFDDAFSYDARWDPADHCTPGEDCPVTVTASTPDIRMTAADVAHVVAWQQSTGYTLTLPFNGYYSQYDADDVPWNGADGLTNALVANRSAFRWLNHGYQHLFQGCVQNFAVVPWVCTTTDGQPVAASGANISWVPQTTIAGEISSNIARGNALGLPFDPAEYLSGEHSGLFRLPQQPVDSPPFAAALSAAAIKFIGADASREPGARVVGGATTVPRHPVAVYYNVSTAAEEVSEYNWFYASRAQGGSGYCDDNPATATCLSAPLDPATGVSSYIVPSDSANDLGFVLSNDPRPFYAHVSNLTAPDYLGLQLLDAILGRYSAAFSSAAPPVNLTLAQASDVLTKQQAWAVAGLGPTPAATGYLQDGKVTVTNTGSAAAPLTVPLGTSVNGAAFGQVYGGEQSGWITGNATVTLAAASFTNPTTATFGVGTAGSFAITTTTSAGGTPTPTLSLAGALPAGVTFTANGDGTATLAGTPGPGTGGAYPLTLTATAGLGVSTQSLTLVVTQAPAFTSAAAATARAGAALSFTASASGYPSPTLSRTGTLPSGLTFRATANGTATITGRVSATAGGTYPLTLTATNPSGTTTQAFTLTVVRAPRFTSSGTATATVGAAFSATISSDGYPTPVLRLTGALPSGLTFTAAGDGTGTITGTPVAGQGGVRTIGLTATNSSGTASFTLTLTVRQAPAFISAAGYTARVGTPFSFTAATSGYPVPSLSRSGAAVSGVSWRDNGDGTMTISGTPTVQGSYPQTLRASNPVSAATQSFVLTVTG